jgi:hypothetical protein
MHNIAELDVLMRTNADFPIGMNPTTDKFRDGWGFRTGDATRLEKKIRRYGWHLIGVTGCAVGGGVGETPQAAIGTALTTVLRTIDQHFNAVGVRHIEMTRYPWFILAKVSVDLYRMQEDANCLCKKKAQLLRSPSCRDVGGVVRPRRLQKTEAPCPGQTDAGATRSFSRTSAMKGTQLMSMPCLLLNANNSVKAALAAGISP